MPEKHLSTQFDSELNSVSSRVMELGGLVDALSALGGAEHGLEHFLGGCDLAALEEGACA